MEDTNVLNPSDLGTKEYWDTAYEKEIKNYEDHGDVGEIWFDESSQSRVIKWIEKQNFPKDISILDVGTGNGMMLISLSSSNYTNLTGIDYSEKSIAFASKIATDQRHLITFKVVDILAPKLDLNSFKIVHDKGTFDAIGLMENSLEHREKYSKNLAGLVEEFFIITSCNFTEEELVEQFKESFEKFEVIPTPTFQFGGKKGNKTVSIVFKKK